MKEVEGAPCEFGQVVGVPSPMTQATPIRGVEMIYPFGLGCNGKPKGNQSVLTPLLVCKGQILWVSLKVTSRAKVGEPLAPFGPRRFSRIPPSAATSSTPVTRAPIDSHRALGLDKNPPRLVCSKRTMKLETESTPRSSSREVRRRVPDFFFCGLF